MYKLGIVGYGGMGSWHAENISNRIDTIMVAGVFDISAERREVAAKDGYQVFESFQMLAASGVDIILVATPNNFHKEYSVAALESGKHVVCEKPVCMNYAELEEINKAASLSGKVFTVHQNRRFDDDYNLVRKLLRENIVGKPYFINSRLFGNKGLPGDWRSNAEAGGGMLYDWSVHLIDQMLHLIDSPVTSVYCELKKVFFKEVDDCNRINLVFENGVNAQIVVDTWCYDAEARWHIGGDDGTIVLHGWPEYTGRIIKANIKEIDWENGVIFTSAGRTRTMSPRPKESITELALPQLALDERTQWESFYNNLCEVIEGKAELMVTMAQQRKLMRVMDACFESNRNSCAVRLASDLQK